MMPMRRPCFTRFLLPFFLLLATLLTGCAKEQFVATTDLDNFQKLQQQKEQAEIKPEVQAVTPAAMTADNPADYLLGAGDLITVTVFESAALNAEVRVSSRGFVSLPLLDNVEVAGLTAAEAEEKIERLYAARYLHDPHVTVYIKEHVSKQITLVGSLVKPGTYDYVSRRRLLDVIAIAQGLGAKAGSTAYVSRTDAKTN
jgi:polysaccharide export outer membrane protein